MAQRLKEDLNDLSLSSKYGFDKIWIYRDKISKEKSGDYLQKIVFSMSDYNKELDIQNKEAKDVIFMILLANWIKDTYNLLLETYKKETIRNYKRNDFSKEKDYLEAVRSFVVAHPMNTTRHKKFKLDGTYICNDICIKDNYFFSFMKDDSIFYLDLDGLHEGKPRFKYDYLLKVYSSCDDMRFFKYICCSFDDITTCVSRYIDELYNLGLYLGSLKKRDFERKSN